MIKPVDPYKITLVDLINSGHGETVTNILIDLNSFWTHENRESLVAEPSSSREGASEKTSSSAEAAESPSKANIADAVAAVTASNELDEENDSTTDASEESSITTPPLKDYSTTTPPL